MRKKEVKRREGQAGPAALLVLLIAVIAAGCGGGDGGDSPEEIIQKVSNAVRQDGMVFHAKGDDGTEVWMDVVGQRYRARQRNGTQLLTSVGAGWSQTSYDPETNTVSTKDSPPSSVPRINDPMILWFEPLSALAYGAEITNLGDTTANGEPVIAVESRTPVGSGGQATGRFLVGRLELDPQTYLVRAFERRLQLPPGETADPASVGAQLGTQNVRVQYEVTEFIPVSDLPADFFEKSQVEAQVVTLEGNIARIRESGITPYWLGERYDAGASVLVLGVPQNAVVIDSRTREASFHYALAIGPGTSGEAVIIRLAPAGPVNFPQPSFPQYAGTLPESVREITVGGKPAALGVSLLTPEALPCPSQQCPHTDAPLFIRLQMQLDGAAVQIETYARVDASGADQNGYNTESGIIQLAEALTAAP